jgi:hypothetical protein
MPKGIPNKQADKGNPGSKMEAVRQALTELGRDAKPKEIQNWAKKEWKLALDTNQISAYKSLLNKQANEGTRKASSAESKISKMEAVRRALAQLGSEAKPQEIQSFLKTNFRIDMGPNLISNYKSTLSRKAAGQSAIIKKPAGVATLASSGGFSLEEIESVKEMVEKIGAERVQQLAEVLAR